MAQYVPDFVNIFEQLSDPTLANNNMIILAKLIRLMNNSFSSKVRVAENSKFDQTGVICGKLNAAKHNFRKDLHFNLTKIEYETKYLFILAEWVQ